MSSKPEDTNQLSHNVGGVDTITHVAGLERSDQREEISSEVPTSSKDIPLRTVGLRPATGSITEETAAVSSPQQNTSGESYVGCLVDDRYRIEEVIGEGGMGVVYLCKHKVIGKRVAMKVLRADLARDQEVTRRFLNEARAASAIGNPHIIDISDFGQFPDGSTYFVMEHLDGVSLTRVIESSQPIPIERIVHIALQLAEALAAAHDAGIIHRDLKPDNIYLISRGSERDFVKILDFGIAKVSTPEGRLTRVGTVFGTPHYMSPEQATGGAVDHRGDIYSLGVILYEMASGRVPFDADNFMGILTQHMYKAPVPIRALVPLIQDIPAGLEAIILKCLSKRAEHRYQSMRELAGELLRVQRGIVPKALPELRATGTDFNLPPDYYQQEEVASDVSRSGWSLRSRWPIYAGLTLAIGIGAAAVALAGSREAPRVTSSPSVSEPSPSPTPADPAPAPVVKHAAAPEARWVVLELKPADAHAIVDGKDLGTSPVTIGVPETTTVSVVVQRADYSSASVTLDGTESQKSVELKKLPHSAHGSTHSGSRGSGKAIDRDDLASPWEKTKPH